MAYIVDRPGSAQSNIVIANPAVTRTHPDYFPLLVMHTVLGGNASARLFMNLREEKGYTYGAYSHLDARRHAGTFRATAEVRTPVTGASLKEFFYELGRIRDEDGPGQELTDAKSYLTGIFPIRLGDAGRACRSARADQDARPAGRLPADLPRPRPARHDAPTCGGPRALTSRPTRAAVVVVGDAAAVTPQVAEYAAEIEFYDHTGQRRAAQPDTDKGSGS